MTVLGCKNSFLWFWSFLLNVAVDLYSQRRIFRGFRFRGFGGISKLRFVPFAAKQLPLLPRYSDSAYTMSQWSTSLEPGVDCPDRATYLSAANWMGPEMSKSPDPRWGPRVWKVLKVGGLYRHYTHHITKPEETVRLLKKIQMLPKDCQEGTRILAHLCLRLGGRSWNLASYGWWTYQRLCP